ncbi:TPA: hypothetical protein JLP25_003523 [Escherichia coli]|uniref:hypothetical protein n=1 Tax=Escherichia coli TaxID=562 RepID=UPI00050BA87C|nr:hypothetical protein [Escherichia coli]EGM8094429.1 hypothetical protein [Escherichia coli]EJD8038232.1 hypothetical protein [Escherichia coli]EJE2977952.1 hypothetical protein [Escherichia coli]EJE6848869.1 hypothetical protein [Escherichia coli]EJE6857897.1 hypothetical protein [Escherichia coli]
MKILLPISNGLLFLPESNAAHQSISPPFQHYTLACEREQINPGINLSELFADNGSPSQISDSVIVPADINKVTIGDDEQIIWARSKG